MADTPPRGVWSRRWSFSSKLLGNERGLWVYLPPGYTKSLARYPVIYLHDGQNLFDPKAAYAGVAWSVGEALDAGLSDGTLPACIAIGIENTPERMNEYAPVIDEKFGGGGRGELYLQMLETELKPFIDRWLRTRREREWTVMVGSSLGGLITAAAGVTHAHVFGRIAALSPSSWWSNGWLSTQVRKTPRHPSARPLRVYVDSGDAGQDRDDVEPTRALADAYRAAGFVDDVELRHVVERGAQHGEAAWARRLPDALRFVLG